MKKKRLDLIIVEKGFAQSRQRAVSMIMAGKILVNNKMVDKSGTRVSINADILVRGNDIPYVSRGGLKLEKALKTFEINTNNKVCLDVGASTGGFTDCLLQHGAGRVFAVDVGYGQLAWKLRQDSRVVVIERTNIRYIPLQAISKPIDIITIDVSFISLKLVIPAVMKFMKKDTIILALIKPQFEAGRDKVGKKGVVRDPVVHTGVIKDLSDFFSGMGFICKSVTPSPIPGQKGNKEFFILLSSLLNSIPTR